MKIFITGVDARVALVKALQKQMYYEEGGTEEYNRLKRIQLEVTHGKAIQIVTED